MSGIISAQQFFRIFPDLNPEISGHSHASLMQAFYTAIYEVGCLAGAIFALFFGNKLGRRKNIMIGGFWVIIGTIIQITCMPGYVKIPFSPIGALADSRLQSKSWTPIRDWSYCHWCRQWS